MKEFDITITETLEKTVTVQANSQEEAEDLVHDQWSQGMYVLDADDFKGAAVVTKAERAARLDALIVEPMKAPVNVQLEYSLEAFQQVVAGWIELVKYFDDPIEIICNEEGKINGMPLNRAIYNEEGEIVEIIAGTFLIVGAGEEDFTSISPEMKEKYANIFEQPERFFKLAGKIVAQKVEPIKEKSNINKSEMER